MRITQKIGAISLLAATLMAADTKTTLFEKNIQDLIKTKMNVDVKVISIKDLPDLKDLKVVTIETPQKQRFPLFVNKNGTTIIGFSNIFLTKDTKSEELIVQTTQELQKFNESAREAQIAELFKSFSNEDFIKLDSKKDKTLIIVTDPECPYCRAELKRIHEKLKEANIKLIFAPVHDKSAFIKAELIMQQAKNAKSNDEIIAILNKYFDEKYQLSEEEKKIEPKRIQENTNKIFSTGLIRGVPFIFEEKK